MADTLAATATEYLRRLVAFDTTSRGSNLALIDYVEAELAKHGARSVRIPNEAGDKANLLALIGPEADGGVVLSGHTDVVPVDGQPWTSDPWTLTDKGDGRLYGRGACDMKAFIALALAAAPLFAEADLKRPVHFAFTYDEEIGCLGAPHLIRKLVAHGPQPRLVIVGEPTSMQLVTAHKSITVFTVTVTGREAHSSQPHLGVSATMEAARLVAFIGDLAKRLDDEADARSPFLPKGPTLTVGLINGGTASNILARECRFTSDLRAPAAYDPETVLAPVRERVEAVDRQLKARFPGCGAALEVLRSAPPLTPEPDSEAEALVRSLTGDNSPGRAVAYAAEAGQFQGAGFSTVICGPGSIDQAHQPDEYIDKAQIERGAAFMARLAESLSES
ncbi:MAG TPA: acetylornithine deacetylase [Caulobacteraceae bacterium]|jgi:acetylornithine deacetylase|nr:acetylornithine deacetylase [Caulobacteraceae bacterium]